MCFEITESAVIANLDHARRFVGVLHGMGCQFALDDFGSGVGSFSNLKNLPLDYLKIDGSFMRNLARDTVNQAMVTAMIKLARTLNFKVIAEQVEDSAAAGGGAPHGRRLPAGLRHRAAAAAAAGGVAELSGQLPGCRAVLPAIPQSSGTSSSATMLMILISGLIAGPAVSL